MRSAYFYDIDLLNEDGEDSEFFNVLVPEPFAGGFGPNCLSAESNGSQRLSQPAWLQEIYHHVTQLPAAFVRRSILAIAIALCCVGCFFRRGRRRRARSTGGHQRTGLSDSTRDFKTYFPNFDPHDSCFGQVSPDVDADRPAGPHQAGRTVGCLMTN